MNEGNSFVGGAADQHIRLMRALAEELRLPLLQIARKSELAYSSVDHTQLYEIQTTAEAALKLVDSYLFSTHLLLGQQKLELEPVSVNAAMYDTAEYLRKLAKLYDCDISIDVSSKTGLVMAHPEGLQAALTSLAYTFVSANTSGKTQRIVLRAHRDKEGIRAGVFSSQKTLPKQSLHQARRLFGSVRRPMPSATHNNGAGIYVADLLFGAMQTSMKTSNQKSSAGLTALLLPSSQLALL